MPFTAWICEGCKAPQRQRRDIWDCPGCDKECCESCFYGYAHCRACADGKTDAELRTAANAKGFDFD